MASSRKLSLTDLSERFAAQIAPLLPVHSSILIGLSGGVDSIVLLHLLHRLPPRFFLRLSALPVHYCIRPHAAAHHLHWIEDESNADDSYPRNFLRHRLLLLLEQKFPACRTTLALSAQHFAEASELLDDLARLDAQIPSPIPSGGEMGEVHDVTLEASRLQSLSQPRARNLLRYFLRSQGAQEI